MTPQVIESFDHGVTYSNTVKHWVLYTLDAYEKDHHDDESSAREEGVYPTDIYEYAAGDDSIVFRSKQEVSSALSEMGRLAEPFGDGDRPVNRRTDATDWDGPDVHYRYRLTPFGRRTLLDLGVPDNLPNRRDLTDDERSLGVKPAHQPGWWTEDTTFDADSTESIETRDEREMSIDEGWDVRDNDWNETDHDRVFYKEGADAWGRGEFRIAEEIAEAFPEATFVVTMGPYRMHDIAYAIRDPFEKVVQLDFYSPMFFHRTATEISANISSLSTDLHRGLVKASEMETDDE